MVALGEGEAKGKAPSVVSDLLKFNFYEPIRPILIWRKFDRAAFFSTRYIIPW